MLKKSSRSRKSTSQPTKKTKGPISSSLRKITAAPRLRGVSASDNSIRVRRSEMIGTAEFNNLVHGFQLCQQSLATPGWDLNPGNPKMFPWLSRIAANFEKFRFDSVTFRAVSGAPTTEGGRVILGFDYDIVDPIPTTTQGVMNNRSAVEGPIWGEYSLHLDSALLNSDLKYRYVSHDTVRYGSSEPRMLYGGFLLLGVTGISYRVSIDVYIDYDVVLTGFASEGMEDTVKASYLGASSTGNNAPYNSCTGGYVEDAFAGLYPEYERLNGAAGPKVVKCGTGDIPALDLMKDESFKAEACVDLRGVDPNTRFAVGGRYAMTNGTPATAAGTGLRTRVFVHDRDGACLGEYTRDPSKDPPRSSLAADTPANFASNGEPFECQGLIDCALMGWKYPTYAFVTVATFALSRFAANAALARGTSVYREITHV